MSAVTAPIDPALLGAISDAVRQAMRDTPASRYMNTVQAAQYLGLSRQYLEIARCKGGGPRFVKLGTAVRYDRGDLDSWMAARKVANTSEEVAP